MKTVLFAIFAHPDDESFGPSGTLIKAAQSGTDVYLLCATRGDAGRDATACGDLAALRRAEWEQAGELIGAAGMEYLGYDDGSLCNALYHELAGTIGAWIEAVVATYDHPVEVSCMTFDVTGLSGHLDHIAVSYITTYAFVRLRQARPGWRFGRLRYYCAPYDEQLDGDTSYLYTPRGRQPEEIDERVDVSAVFERKLEVMRTHQSQRDDLDWHLRRREGLRYELFRYLT